MILLQAVTQHKDGLTRYLALSSGYYERYANSNESLVQAPLSVMQGSSQIFDLLMKTSSKKWVQILLGIGYTVPHIWLSALNEIAYHEWGHARAIRAAGGDYDFYSLRRYRTRYFFGMYGQGMIFPFAYSFFGGATHIRNLDRKYMAYLSMGGINNEMRLTQEISNLVFHQNGHLLYGIDYFRSKFAAMGYAIFFNNPKMRHSNDLTDLKLSDDEIKLVNTATLFLSATTWAFLSSIVKGQLLVKPLVWRGWRLPDFNMYFSTQSEKRACDIAIEMVTGYRINPAWYVGLEIGCVYRNKLFEIRPEIAYTKSFPSGELTLKAQGVVNTNYQMSWSAGVDWTFWKKRFTIKAKYIQHNPYTLLGERNIPFWKVSEYKKDKDHELCVVLCWNYSR